MPMSYSDVRGILDETGAYVFKKGVEGVLPDSSDHVCGSQSYQKVRRACAAL